ncbi:hypothetical protein ABW19_dt0204293 [Dactylella cylindrospora]|nr:hypothetical protein ABW19_dt0204293 [Dactylella cylindrospora]
MSEMWIKIWDEQYDYSSDEDDETNVVKAKKSRNVRSKRRDEARLKMPAEPSILDDEPFVQPIKQIVLSGDLAYRYDMNTFGIYSLDLSQDPATAKWVSLADIDLGNLSVYNDIAYKLYNKELSKYDKATQDWGKPVQTGIAEAFADASLASKKLYFRTQHNPETIQFTDVANPGSPETVYTDGDYGNRVVRQIVGSDTWLAFRDNYGSVCFKELGSGKKWKEVYNDDEEDIPFHLEKSGNWIYLQTRYKDDTQSPPAYSCKLLRWDTTQAQKWDKINDTLVCFAPDGANAWIFDGKSFSYYDDNKKSWTPVDVPVLKSPDPPSGAAATDGDEPPPAAPKVEVHTLAANNGKFIFDGSYSIVNDDETTTDYGLVFLWQGK